MGSGDLWGWLTIFVLSRYTLLSVSTSSFMWGKTNQSKYINYPKESLGFRTSGFGDLVVLLGAGVECDHMTCIILSGSSEQTRATTLPAETHGRIGTIQCQHAHPPRLGAINASCSVHVVQQPRAVMLDTPSRCINSTSWLGQVWLHERTICSHRRDRKGRRDILYKGVGRVAPGSSQSVGRDAC